MQPPDASLATTGRRLSTSSSSGPSSDVTSLSGASRGAGSQTMKAISEQLKTFDNLLTVLKSDQATHGEDFARMSKLTGHLQQTVEKLRVSNNKLCDQVEAYQVMIEDMTARLFEAEERVTGLEEQMVEMSLSRGEGVVEEGGGDGEARERAAESAQTRKFRTTHITVCFSLTDSLMF